MNRDINAAFKQRGFNLAGEKPFAADVFQRAVLNFIAGGFNHHDLKGALLQGKSRRKPVASFIGLRQRQRRAAGANFKRRAWIW